MRTVLKPDGSVGCKMGFDKHKFWLHLPEWGEGTKLVLDKRIAQAIADYVNEEIDECRSNSLHQT